MVPHWGARPQGANGPSSTCSPPVALAGERTLLIASTLTFSTRASTASVPDLQQAAGRSAFLQHGVCSARSSLKRWSLKRCSLNHLCEAEDGKRLDQRPQCAGEREGAARALSGRIGPSSTALMALSPAAPTFWVRNGARQRCTARCKRSEEEQARPADLRGGLCRVQVRAHHDAAFKFHMKRRADDRAGSCCSQLLEPNSSPLRETVIF